MSDASQIDKQAMRRSFERAAKTYDLVAVLQRQVADHMAERLQYIKLQPATVLDAGAGTGYGTRLLRQRYPEARMVALDIALSMLHAGRSERPSLTPSPSPGGRGVYRPSPSGRRVGDEGVLSKLFTTWKHAWQQLAGLSRESYLCADLEQLPLRDASVDMIWSNLALQWCNDLDSVFTGMRRVLRPDGLFMFTTFGPDTLKELRQAFDGVDGHSHVNRFVDMHDVGDALVRAGFAEPVMDVEYFTLTYDTLRDLMRDLKALGAHNATIGRPHGLSGKAAWRRLEENYEKLRRDGKLPVTYEVVYGHAWRGTKEMPTKRQDGAKVVQFIKRI